MSKQRSIEELGPLGEWVDEMQELYAQGMDDIEVMSTLRISKRAWNQLLDASDVFKECVEFGQQLSQAWWHKRAREATDKKKSIDSGSLKFNLQNRHDWTDKVEQKGPPQSLLHEKDKRELLEILSQKMESLKSSGLIEGSCIDVTPKRVEHEPS